MKNTIRLFFILTSIIACSVPSISQDSLLKKILIVVEGNSDLKNYAMGDGRQLAQLMGISIPS